GRRRSWRSFDPRPFPARSRRPPTGRARWCLTPKGAFGSKPARTKGTRLEKTMSEKRINVWVQRFKDRPTLMLQWIDPETGRRKSKSAETADPGEAEQARADHEYELNHGKYQEVSKLEWDRVRELVE